jgi:glycosyltransferase involved in cell wall biosynthesis
MRIAVIHPSMLPKGGAERVVMWLCESLARRGHAVTLITSDYDEYWGARKNLAFPVVELRVHGHEWRAETFDDWRRAADLLQPLLRDFDLVNPHNYPAYVWAEWAREGLPHAGRPPIVWYCEEPFRAFYRQITDEHCLRAARMRETDPLSLRVRSELRRPAGVRDFLRRALAKAKRTVLPKGFDQTQIFGEAERIDREVVPKLDLILANSGFIASNVNKIFGVEARACHLGIPVREVAVADIERRPFLLSVTRLQPEKNVDSCLRAVALLRERGALPFERFVIAGDGTERAYLERLAEVLGLHGVVEFRGFVPDAEIDELYRTAGAVLYVSLDETFGLVFLEAAQYHKTAIGPACGGPPELVLDGVTGITVAPLDVDALAGAISTAFSDPEANARMGEAAYARLMDYFTFEKFVDRFEAELAGLKPVAEAAGETR